MSRKSRKFGSAKLFAVLLIVALAVAGALLYHNHSGNASQTGADNGSVNLNPPSAAELKDTKAHEDAAAQASQSGGSGSTSSTKQKVTPIISSWRRVDADTFGVNGYVQEVVESGGTCTLRLERQGQVVTKSKQAFANATNTTCGVIEVPYSSLSKGTWQATLSYSSSTSIGTSSTVSIDVQ